MDQLSCHPPLLRGVAGVLSFFVPQILLNLCERLILAITDHYICSGDLETGAVELEDDGRDSRAVGLTSPVEDRLSP